MQRSTAAQTRTSAGAPAVLSLRPCSSEDAFCHKAAAATTSAALYTQDDPDHYALVHECSWRSRKHTANVLRESCISFSGRFADSNNSFCPSLI